MKTVIFVSWTLCPWAFLLVLGEAIKPVQSSSLWSGLISHLRSSLKVKRRRVHFKSHHDCFLGSEAVDVVAEHINHVKAFEGVCLCSVVVCVWHHLYLFIYEPKDMQLFFSVLLKM